MSSEFIRYAAIEFHSTIFSGKNHGECIKKAKLAMQQGFLADSYTGTRFVSRRVALRIAIAAGQKITKHKPMRELVSEDLSKDGRFNI